MVASDEVTALTEAQEESYQQLCAYCVRYIRSDPEDKIPHGFRAEFRLRLAQGYRPERLAEAFEIVERGHAHQDPHKRVALPLAYLRKVLDRWGADDVDYDGGGCEYPAFFDSDSAHSRYDNHAGQRLAEAWERAGAVFYSPSGDDGAALVEDDETNEEGGAAGDSLVKRYVFTRPARSAGTRRLIRMGGGSASLSRFQVRRVGWLTPQALSTASSSLRRSSLPVAPPIQSASTSVHV
jgi:hypothetical protein